MKINSLNYFNHHGVDIMCFDDFYPSGHQSGVSIIMHGNRVASNGDLRYGQRPEGWGWEPVQGERIVDTATNTIKTHMHFAGPDDGKIHYTVTVTGTPDTAISITVDFEAPAPSGLEFNLELFPGALFGKPYIMDGATGFFPRQPNGPEVSYATGHHLTIQPNDPHNRYTITSDQELHLHDGRFHDIQGWFKVTTFVKEGATTNAIQWKITPTIVEEWRHTPVVQMSQVGFHPAQPKTVIVELDKRETSRETTRVFKITETGETEIKTITGTEWGQFLRYNYLKFDISDVSTPGLYKIRYGTSESPLFTIDENVYDRGIWQPVLEYFLPVQMCHMRVNENGRVWHGLCHMDDARMAPVNHDHFDGYWQGAETLTKYKPGEHVPGLNIGGWHDAGDDDLRTESQAGEVYILALAYESFDVYLDSTTICQDRRIARIHEPDGKNDILQQIEHGLLSVVGAYKALGRLYRGIITNNMAQYSLICDFSTQTDNVISDDDRWVFTEDNPTRELTTAAQLAAAARCMAGFNDTLAADTLTAAKELYQVTRVESDEERAAKVHAAAELYLTTQSTPEADIYKTFLIENAAFIAQDIYRVGWFIGRAEKAINDPTLTAAIRGAMPTLAARLQAESAETPYGIPYRPHIWGAGWDIQRLGFNYYFLHKAYPDIFGPDLIYDSLNFILGCHPGSNNTSFASGVGETSALVAYGHNRADYSFIPGGVISGTALIRPDFPELLTFPFLWQQTEYVLGGGSSHYMFLVLAAQQIAKG